MNSSKGYCSLGNGAIGQSNDGTSSLWIDLECVVAKQPLRDRPRTVNIAYMTYKTLAKLVKYAHTVCLISGYYTDKKKNPGFTAHVFKNSSTKMYV